MLKQSPQLGAEVCDSDRSACQCQELSSIDKVPYSGETCWWIPKTVSNK